MREIQRVQDRTVAWVGGGVISITGSNGAGLILTKAIPLERSPPWVAMQTALRAGSIPCLS